MTSRARILLVEDEQNIRSGLRDVLTGKNHEVQEAGDAERALAILKGWEADVAIVDIRMPGISGIALLKELRARWPHLAVIMLTGHGSLESAMAAVKAGAHDYLLKPAQPKEILSAVAQAHTLSRRRREESRLLGTLRTSLQRIDQLGRSGEPGEQEFTRSSQRPKKLTIGDLTVDLAAHEVRRGGHPISLSPTEFKLLVALAERAGEAVTYVELVAYGLGYETEAWEAKELVKRHVFSIRQKLEPNPSVPQYLINIRSVGYRLALPASP